MLDGPKWRRSEFISITTFLTVATWIWYVSAKVKTYDIVCDTTIGNGALDRRLTVVETHVKDKDDEILRQLGMINRRLDKVRGE